MTIQAASPTGYRNYNILDSGWLTGQNHIDSLLSKFKWHQDSGTSSTVLTYSLAGLGTSYYSTSYPDGDGDGAAAYMDGWQPLNSFEMNQVRLALSLWSNVANITFQEVVDSSTVAGDLRFAFTTDAPTAYAYLPGGTPWAGDVWLGNNDFNHNPQVGTYGFGSILLHEIGHALGLKHPHEAADDFNLGPVGTGDNDSLLYSIMSYRDYAGDGLDGVRLGDQPRTPMINDIAAIQHLYGANWSYNSGNTFYDYSGRSQILETIWDGGGTDTISWAGRSEGCEINLTPGTYSKIGSSYSTEDGRTESRTLGIAYNCWIENATGGNGADRLTGNSLANVLRGAVATTRCSEKMGTTPSTAMPETTFWPAITATTPSGCPAAATIRPTAATETTPINITAMARSPIRASAAARPTGSGPMSTSTLSLSPASKTSPLEPMAPISMLSATA